MKTRILVVDDEPDILEIVKDSLESEGFDVRTADNADDFRREVLENPPALIVLDIMLGNDNGAEIYGELAEEGLDHRIPVLFLTGLAGDRPPSFSYPGRAYAMLGKPFKIDDLCREVHCLVSSAA